MSCAGSTPAATHTRRVNPGDNAQPSVQGAELPKFPPRSPPIPERGSNTEFRQRRVEPVSAMILAGFGRQVTLCLASSAESHRNTSNGAHHRLRTPLKLRGLLPRGPRRITFLRCSTTPGPFGLLGREVTGAGMRPKWCIRSLRCSNLSPVNQTTPTLHPAVQGGPRIPATLLCRPNCGSRLIAASGQQSEILATLRYNQLTSASHSRGSRRQKCLN
jgi:hypothetical protein